MTSYSRVVGVKISIHAPLAGRDFTFRPSPPHTAHFNPRAPCGARHIATLDKSEMSIFQSTRPLRGATILSADPAPAESISIHAPLAGRDPHARSYLYRHRHFNPRAPCGARLERVLRIARSLPISIHAPLAGRDDPAAVLRYKALKISIHAPLAGRDVNGSGTFSSSSDFNPRAPCGARPLLVPDGHLAPSGISIHAPLAGRDQAHGQQLLTDDNISIHAPLAGRDIRSCNRVLRFNISIHAPLAGRDVLRKTGFAQYSISIHAPLAGRDQRICFTSCASTYFNPRAPCGARQILNSDYKEFYYISIHAPLAGRDRHSDRGTHRREGISIHAPLAGRDCIPSTSSKTCWFISIHAPLAGRDGCYEISVKQMANISIHAPLAGRDTLRTSWRCGPTPFQSTRPLRGATQLRLHTGFGL